ncbi:hypothetical protein [Caballeronia sp. SL2Y3]|uniref:hypothetical protein n=1 Tax=Caballeronia sp. SL2Y3 TaxID=2878151 RepID=UPI001FD6251C|nr:hypothetical protein [Caballeronia sp. SL2Y3]
MKRTTLIRLFDAPASGFIWVVAMCTLRIVLARDWLQHRMAARRERGNRGDVSPDRDIAYPKGT